ncbi:hypothetical protein PIB30_033658 [Stylosanthes scabra]|uniref:Uncharacterized protein n=1 Tax=Stylosanthes scabra TaxID=79078 RepID=A0ABU6TCA8_9FABA|nr:hypothetical protein [Stylosanthes scabra]
MAKGAWPIIGHLMLLGGTPTPHKSLGSMAEKYGPIFSIKLGAKRALVINNWEIAKECYTKNDLVVSSRSKLVAIEHIAYNQASFGFAPYGPFWREMRKIVTVFLSNRRSMEILRHVRFCGIKNSVKDLFDAWDNSKNKNESGYVLVEMKEWFTRLVFNIVFQTMAGKRYFGTNAVVSEKEAEKCVKAVREFMHMLGVCTMADAIPLLRWINFGVKAMKETAKELDVILDAWLVEHTQKKKNRVLGEKVIVENDDHQDFMDMMISVLDGVTIEGFDANTINKATTLALILGATDTSTVTLTWTICLLLRHPHALEKVKQELNTKIGKERFINESDINKLAYLQAVVKETLRLYPPGPLSAPREFTEDCTLGGYHIKKGTRLITNLWKIQTDPNVWEDPMEFKPERFLTTHKEVDVRGHHFELLPFGSGRRICPGISFGLNMIHLTLANFLHSFDISSPSSEPIDMTEILGMTNEKATPLEIMVKPLLSTKYYETMPSDEC